MVESEARTFLPNHYVECEWGKGELKGGRGVINRDWLPRGVNFLLEIRKGNTMWMGWGARLQKLKGRKHWVFRRFQLEGSYEKGLWSRLPCKTYLMPSWALAFLLSEAFSHLLNHPRTALNARHVRLWVQWLHLNFNQTSITSNCAVLFSSLSEPKDFLFQVSDILLVPY